MSKDYSFLNEKKRLVLASAESLNEHINEVFNNGYDQGFEDGKTSLYPMADGKTEEAYQAGMDDAWDAAKKLALKDDDGGISALTIEKIFGIPFYDVIKDGSPREVIKTLKAYEDSLSSSEKPNKSDNIKVGDEVIINDEGEEVKAVVMDIDSDKAIWVFDENGCNSIFNPDDIKRVVRTGKHYSQIEEMLKQMRGDKA